MKRVLIFIFLILALSVIANAQTLHIRVLDSFTGKPVKGVEILGANRFLTDENGQTEISVLDEEEQLHFLRTDYYPLVIQASIRNFDNPYEIDFYLVRKGSAIPSGVSMKNPKMTGYVEIEYEFAEDSVTDSNVHIWVYDEMNSFAKRTTLSSSSAIPEIIRINWAIPPELMSANSATPPVHLTKFIDDGKKYILTSF